jgi:hypothetical protein
MPEHKFWPLRALRTFLVIRRHFEGEVYNCRNVYPFRNPDQNAENLIFIWIPPIWVDAN